jgi:transposase-like protein
MGARLAAIRAKGIEKQEWQRYYNQHQRTYKRNKLKAVELAVAHTGSFHSLARTLGCSNTSLANWLDCYPGLATKNRTKD